MAVQSNEYPSRNPVTWHVTIRKLHKWISEPGEKASRPFVLMITDPERKNVIRTRIISEEPDPTSVLEWIIQAIEPHGSQPPSHPPPGSIVFDDQALADQLLKPLSERHIRCEYLAVPDQADEAISMFEGMIEESAPDIPGLFTIEGLTPQQASQLFAEAEQFFRSRPWEALSDHQPVAMHMDPPGSKIFVQLMGQAGIQTGINIFREWDSLLKLLDETVDPIGQIPLDGLHSFTFESSNMLPASDLDAVEKLNLPIAAAGAYPLPLIYTTEAVRRPSLEELALFQAVLQTVPKFIQRLENDPLGDYLPHAAEFQVDTLVGAGTANLSYPAGVIPLTDEGQEGDLSSLVEVEPGDENGEELFAELRLLEAEAGSQHLAEFSDDPLLQDAQQLVYKAWTVNDGLERRLLARQALELSEDCADAYNILAEEEAQTIEEAHGYYFSALQAAERHLGAGYARAFEGMFWEKFKTRPLMRALEGMANTLVELEKPTNSLDYFKKLLELDADDHLGARYGYLHTLMDLMEYQAAHHLIHSFPNEISAFWSYTHALISWILKGKTSQADTSLRWALQQNPFVPAYLLGEKLLPQEFPDAYGLGDEDEAVYYAADYFNFWWQTPGAIDWLKNLQS